MRQKFFYTLKSKLILFSLLAVTISVSLASITSIKFFTDKIKKIIISSIYSNVEDLQSFVDSYREHLDYNLKTIASEKKLKKIIVKGDKSALHNFLNQKINFFPLDYLFCIDNDGRLINYVGKGSINPVYTPGYISKSKDIYLTSRKVYTLPQNKNFTGSFFMEGIFPVFMGDKKIASLVGGIDFSTNKRLLNSIYHYFPESMCYFLINGRVKLHIGNKKELVGKFDQLINFAETIGKKQLIKFGDKKFIIIQSKFCKKIISSDCKILIAFDFTEIENMIFFISKRIGMISLVFLLISVLFTLNFSKKITTPVKNVVEGMHAAAMGNFEYKVLNHSRKDELGKLISGFNYMSETLYIWEKELQLEKKKAIESSMLKTEFLANMSHEIRTPMNGIIGMASLMFDTEMSEEQKGYAEIIKNSAESLLELVNDVLDFSKIEAAKLELEIIDFNLRNILEEVSDLISFRAEEKKLDFVYMCEPDVPLFLTGDPGRLRQIIVNLASNAIKFTDTGEVSIKVCKEKLDHKRVKLKFIIKDTGTGISKNKHEELFNPFVQGDGSITRQYGGTGLGLAISKQLTEMMDGEIGFSSNEGEGSVFWFTSVFKLGKKTDFSESYVSPDKKIKDLKIMVIEEHQMNNKHIKSMLEMWGCYCQTAFSGSEGVKKLLDGIFSENPYDILILNYRLSGIDGRRLANILRADSRFSDLKIVCMSFMRDKKFFVESEKIFNSFLPKPVKQSQLFNCIANLNGEIGLDMGNQSYENNSINFDSDKFEKYRVLVVEDNITNQKVALSILSKIGINGEAVANGKEALRIYKHIPFDLILMDVHMPEMDGIEATKIIRKNEETFFYGDRAGRVPIIAMTADVLKGYDDKCFSAGMDDYVSKPVNPKILAIKIFKWLKVSKENLEQTEDEKNKKLAYFNYESLIERLMGDADDVKELITIFKDTIKNDINRLNDSINKKDFNDIKKFAHSIKGAAGNMCAEILSMKSGEIQKFAEEMNFDKLSESFKNFNDIYNSTIEEMVKFIDQAT